MPQRAEKRALEELLMSSMQKMMAASAAGLPLANDLSSPPVGVTRLLDAGTGWLAGGRQLVRSADLRHALWARPVIR